MSIYYLYIKSHNNFSDYEDECKARSKNQATDIFLKKINKQGEEWGKKELARYVGCDDDCPMCNTRLNQSTEIQGNYKIVIDSCLKCGWQSFKKLDKNGNLVKFR